MLCLNVEIKAKCSDSDKIKKILKSRSADFRGTDHQIDTYFKVNNGRLKLREGNIENHLIYYDIKNKEGPKESKVILFKNNPGSTLKDILLNSIGSLVIVDKEREIYFINNIKFYIDIVKELGSFVEIEAIDKDGSIGKDELYIQCKKYMKLFSILDKDLSDI